MKVIHIAPNAPYNESWGYQENLLPKFQAKLGHEVVLIITTMMHDDGKLKSVGVSDTISEDGFRVIRLPQIKSKLPRLSDALAKLDVYGLLVELKPDFVFFHGLVSPTIFQVVKYKKRKNPKCIIVQDNHLDYNIGFDPSASINKRVLGLIYRLMHRRTDKYIDRVYGVTPWRKEFAERVMGVSSSKTDVLVMGADDDLISFNNKDEIRRNLRAKHGIEDDTFFIVSGAKIDRKKQIHILMAAVNGMDKVKLLIFGNVMDDVRKELEQQLSEQVIWVGWIDARETYMYFQAADLVFFPGQHSVLWEQACACKVPCVFAKWDGMNHVDVGGNADLVTPITKESIRKKILELKFTTRYREMKAIAESAATDIFLYSNIAKKSLEIGFMNNADRPCGSLNDH